MDLDASFAQLGDNRGQMFGSAAGKFECAVRDGPGHEKCAGFDAVRNDGMPGPVEFLLSTNANRRCSRTLDFRAHLDE